MADDIKITKEKRSRLKARVSTLARQLSTSHATNHEQLYNELSHTYTEFLETHYALSELVQSDAKYADLGVVSGLDLDDYLNSVQASYDNAVQFHTDRLVNLKALDVDILLERTKIMSSKFSTRDFDASSIEEAETLLFQCNNLFQELCVFDAKHILCAKLGQCIREFDAQVLNAKQPQIPPRVGFNSTTCTTVPSGSGLVTSSHSSSSNSTPHTTNALSQAPLMHHQGGGADRLHRGLSGLAVSNRAQSTILSNTRGSLLQTDPELSIVTAYEQSTHDPLLSNSRYSLPQYSRSGLDREVDHEGGYRSRFKRSPPPVFNGNRRDWAEFRAVWLRYGELEFGNDEERAWALKGCLKGKALDCVRAIYATQPGAYARIWHRLDSIYSDISLSVQSAYDDLKKLRPVREDDSKALVRLVNEVELCYSQLGEVCQIKSITMSHIDDLCDLLPISARKDWMKIYLGLSEEEKIRPFPSFMSFLEGERSVAMRLSEREEKVKTFSRPKSVHQAQASQHFSDSGNSSSSNVASTVTLCLIHNKPGAKHKTEQCSKFKELSVPERLSLLKKHHACFQCLGDHMRKSCTSNEPCSVCRKVGHHTLLCREATTDSDNSAPAASAGGYHSLGAQGNHTVYPIQEVSVVGVSRKALVFFDGGSNASFISCKAAKALKARRLSKVSLDLTTVGKRETRYTTHVYELKLASRDGARLIQAYAMEQITGEVEILDQRVIRKLFPDYADQCLVNSRQVDILVGSDYFGLHPKRELARAGEHLSLMEGPLGVCIQGRHQSESPDPHMSAHSIEVLHASHHVNAWCHSISSNLSCSTTFSKGKIDDFITGEYVGTEVTPKCGGCRCSKCPLPGHTYSFNEEREIAMIRNNLTYDAEGSCWVTKYPWIRDPATLPDNYNSVLATLRSTERKLKGDDQWAKIYTEQIEDMLNRKVAKKLTADEVADWHGPFFYISHLAVSNPKSSTTPVRIVFNSSQKFQGVSLNSYLAKGPDAYLNNLLGILLRWREERVVLVSDIRKMYNSIHIAEVEQHCHRFLWRDLQDKEPDVYIIVRVNMGDRPAAAISTEALYKTAELFQEQFPLVAELLTKSTYVDDIVHSVSTKEQAQQLEKDTDEVLQRAGFITKGWVQKKECRILGVHWDSELDEIFFNVSLNFTPKKRGVHTGADLQLADIPRAVPDKLTRRIALEQVMRFYDPLGLLCPFTLQAKVLLRRTWQLELGWDEALPADLHMRWVKFFSEFFEVSSLRFDRCLSPSEKVGSPVLVVLSDGSDVAYGASAYVRWQLTDGMFWSRLIIAKCRIAPQRRISTPQMELNGAVLSKRIRKVVEKESRFQFSDVYHLVDSSTVLNMINKLSTRFKLYEGVRIGEIQAATDGNMKDWYWVPGQDNIADWVTRCKLPSELGPESEWWRGPAFLRLPTELWPVKSHGECNDCTELPGEKDPVTLMRVEVQKSLLDYERFSTAAKVVWTIVIVISVVRQHTLHISIPAVMIPTNYDEAKSLVVRDVQREIEADCLKLKQGRYSRLNPQKDATGIWRVGYRMLEYSCFSKDPANLPVLLPSSHRFTALLMREAHVSSGHRGRDATLARFRQYYWTPQGSKLAKNVRNSCQLCRLRDSRPLDVPMGLLPAQRLQAGRPPFHATMVDLFGPYAVRGEVQKRTTGKAYGIIFTDLSSRAVHVEGVFGYDTASFLLALTRFVCIRGWPQVIYSDPGTQLIGADRELKEMWQHMDRRSVYKQSAENGTMWKFGPADSPWYQGAVEVLVKAAKRSFKFAFGNQRLSPSEFLTVCAQATNMLNERPLGVMSVGEEVSVLTPNCLLLGRPYASNPGHWGQDVSIQRRLQVIDEVAEAFWKRWSELYLPTLFLQRKWKKHGVDLQVGDVVVVSDSNSLRGQYRLALVREVFPGEDGRVGQVALEYKNFKTGEKVHEYKGAKGMVIRRSTRRLARLASVGEEGFGLGCGQHCSG